MTKAADGQKSLERKSTRLNTKSVQEVSKQRRASNGRHPKTDLRYWEKRSSNRRTHAMDK